MLEERANWTPARMYKHLCECFRREPGKLLLSQREFTAARGEYVRHAARAWNERQSALAVAGRPAPPPSRPAPSQRKPHRRRKAYLRQTRESAFDRVPGDWRLRPQTLLRMLHEAEFAWIILRGEGRALRVQSRRAEPVTRTLKARYNYLPQAQREGLLEDLETRPFDHACEELAEKLHTKPESIPVMLAPSQRRRASLPPQIVRLTQADEEPPDEAPPVLGRRRTPKKSPAS